MKKLIFILTLGLIFFTKISFAQATKQVEDPHAKAIRMGLQAGGLIIKHYPMSSKNYGPFLLELGFEAVSPQNYTPLLGDMRVFQPYDGGDPNGFVDGYDGHQWVSDYKEDGFWPNPKYEKYHPLYQIFRWSNRK